MARLCGTHRHTIDKKKRIFLPVKIRENIGETFIAIKSLSAKCITLYPEEVWQEFEAVIKALPKVTGEPIRRRIYSSMEELTPDGQGRILIPAELADYAGLEKNVVVIGMGDYAEIWSDINRAEEAEREDSPDMMAAIRELGL